MNSRIYDSIVQSFSSKNCPCRNCKQNNEICHTICDRYAEYQRELNKVRDNARKQYNKDMMLDDYKIDTAAKHMKRKQKQI